MFGPRVILKVLQFRLKSVELHEGNDKRPKIVNMTQRVKMLATKMNESYKVCLCCLLPVALDGLEFYLQWKKDEDVDVVMKNRKDVGVDSNTRFLRISIVKARNNVERRARTRHPPLSFLGRRKFLLPSLSSSMRRRFLTCALHRRCVIRN